MSPYRVVVLLCLLGSGASNSSQKSDYTEKQPNIIYILSDDLGHSDVGFTNGFVETPHLNRLAQEGKSKYVLINKLAAIT